MTQISEIQKNIDRIRSGISTAAEKSGRSASDITLLAVTKLHEIDEMEAAIAAGISDIAENKVQELVRKYPLMQSHPNWHLIGHLQTNKVKQVVGKVSLIHSVDSVSLAREIDKRAENSGLIQDILIQVNAAGEAQKSGVSPEETEPLIFTINELCKNIRIRGLMFIAPAAEDPEDVRKYFRQVKILYDQLAQLSLERVSMEILSMGMSGDYEVAIEEGSNMVRIGTAIFGKRDYSKQ